MNRYNLKLTLIIGFAIAGVALVPGLVLNNKIDTAYLTSSILVGVLFIIYSLVKDRTVQDKEQRLPSNEINPNKSLTIDNYQTTEAYRIINHSPVVLFKWSKIPGQPLSYVSDNVIELTGYTKDEFISGKVIYRNIVHTDDLPRVDEEVLSNSRDLSVSGYNHKPYRIITKDGRVKWVDDTTEIMRDKHGKIMHYEGIVLDITKRIEIEQALIESEKRYRVLIETTPIPTIVHAGGRIVYANYTAMETLGGKSIDDFLGKSPLDFVHEDFRDLVKTRIVNAYECNKGATPMIEKFIRLDGSVIDVEVVGAVVEYSGQPAALVTFQDISERKAAEELLIESEEKYRNVVERATDGICVVQDNKLHFVNSALADMLGQPLQKMIGDEYSSYIYPDELPKVSEIHNKRMTGAEVPPLYESALIASNGQKVDVEFNSGIIQYRGRPANLVFVRNITESKKAKKDLERLQALLLASIDNTPAGIVIADAPDMNIIFINATTLGAFSNQAATLVNTPLREFSEALDLCYPDGTRYQFEDMPLPRAILKGETIDNEEICIKKDSNECDWVLVNAAPVRNSAGEIIAGVAVFPDITEFKKATQEIRNSEKKFQELFNSVMEGLCLADHNDIIEFCNPALAEIFEENHVVDMIGNTINQYVASNYREMIEEETAKRKSGLSSQYELEIITGKGNRRILLVTVSPRFNDKNEYIGTFGSAIDITETKRLQEFAARAQRLETAGRIAGQVAHDFNNLLGPLMAYPEFIKKDLPEGHPAIQYLADIEAAAEQMAEINQQLLTLGRRGHYNLEPLIMNDIARQIISQLQPLPDSLKVSLDLEDNLMPIEAGSSQIYRVVLNLITNARDAMLDMGVLTISTENIYIDKPTGKFGRIPKGEYVRLAVIDTGTGISSEILPKILEPFFSTKSPGSRKGSGLGLSIVNTVMEDHNGYIDIESEMGVGTSFYLYFPVTRKSPTVAKEDEIVGGDEKILIIDDDHIQRTVCTKLLEKLGYEAFAVSSGEMAIEHLKNNQYDLLILDMIMPDGMNGLETYKKILEISPGQKAIAVSGYAESELVKGLIDLGAGAFVKKPLTLKSLATTTRNELDRVPVTKSQKVVSG